MIAYSTVSGYSQLLGQLSTAALVDLRALLSSVQGQAPEQQRAVIVEAFPEVFDPYAIATSQVTATFYEELRGMSDVSGAFQAETLESVEAGRWRALAGFGTAPAVFEQGGSLLAYSLLAGGLTSVLSEASADTVVGNASVDRAPVRFQRVPSPGCCAFCGMLASRGAAYSSKAAASGVVGRGVDVSKTRGRRGGQARGVRSRGSRGIGQEFHDHCKCRAVPVFGDNSVELQSGATKYFESYADARDKVNAGLTLEADTFKGSDGSLKNTYRWVDAGGGQVKADDKTKRIAAAMRADLGVK